ncbi:MAG: Clp protease N-terminal domain-containing protein [Bryobacteraceae bacterium]
MFERYTEHARRIIFFARYEASQFGSPSIESEHLLLGLIREDRPFAVRILRTQAALDSIRYQVEAHAPKRPAISASVDLPLTAESKRILVFANEEAENLGHRYIDTPHLMLGILREPGCLAANILLERQVAIEAVRTFATLKKTTPTTVPTPTPRPLWPSQSLLDALQLPETTLASNVTLRGIPIDLALYKGPGIDTDGDPLTPTTPHLPVTLLQQAAALRRRLKGAIQSMEHAIRDHNFDIARRHSDEEHALRRQLHEIGPEAEPVPALAILLLSHESLLQTRASLQILHDAGLPHIWLIDHHGSHLYTSTPAGGLHETSAETLSIPNPPITIQRQDLIQTN